MQSSWMFTRHMPVTRSWDLFRFASTQSFLCLPDTWRATQVRKMSEGLIRGDSPMLQDAGKLIAKFWDLSKLEKPPYRVAFGEDAKVRTACSDCSILRHSNVFFSGRLHRKMDRSQVGFGGERGVVERPHLLINTHKRCNKACS